MAVKKIEKDLIVSLPPKIVKISEEHSCELNQVEWENRAREFAESQQMTEAQKERKKSITAELNADLKSAEARETKLAHIVANRREQRDVTVEVKYDYDLGIVTKVRTDTGDTISTRDMTTDERQSQLDFVDANDAIAARHE